MRVFKGVSEIFIGAKKRHVERSEETLEFKSHMKLHNPLPAPSHPKLSLRRPPGTTFCCRSWPAICVAP